MKKVTPLQNGIVIASQKFPLDNAINLDYNLIK